MGSATSFCFLIHRAVFEWGVFVQGAREGSGDEDQEETDAEHAVEAVGLLDSSHQCESQDAGEESRGVGEAVDLRAAAHAEDFEGENGQHGQESSLRCHYGDAG